MFNTILEFFKTAGEWGIIVFGIAFICVVITFITLVGVIVFALVAKTVWTALTGGSQSKESVQYTLLKKLLIPIITNGGKDLAKMVSDKLEENEKSNLKHSVPKKYPTEQSDIV